MHRRDNFLRVLDSSITQVNAKFPINVKKKKKTYSKNQKSWVVFSFFSDN